MVTSILLAALLSTTSLDDDEPDLLVLADGKRVECRVLFEDDTRVVYRAKKKNQEVARSEVSEVQSLERSLREYLEQFERIDAHDPRALAELAAFAESRFLPAESKHCWARIVLLDPENEQAWTKLGGKKGRQGWRLEVRGRYLMLEQLRERFGEWKTALELPTAHFLIRTDAAIDRALDVALDVERACQEFYRVLGPPLGLYVFDEVPEIHIFSDQKDYPAPPTQGARAWFERSSNTLNVDAHERPNPGEVVAELTETLIFNAFRRTLDQRTGEIEPWAREGLSQAFAVAVRPDPGRVRFEFGSPYGPWFEQHAADAKPLSLKEVLRAGFASFDSGTDASRYVAQSYTLTHFLVFAEDGKYRKPYAEFLRDSYLGKGGTSQFEKALGVKLEELEKAWTAYVKEIAGG